MKQILLNTSVGIALLALRDKINILSAALCSPEKVGMIANDQLAIELITKLCRGGKLFIDVGAHIGSVVAMVERNDKTVEIVAIEAIPNKVENLKRYFKNVTVHGCAVGETEGEASFFIHVKRSGYSTMLTPSLAQQSEHIQEITVTVKELDNLVPPDNVDAIKIDVEGYELGVLKGSEKILRKSRPIIMFESGLFSIGVEAAYTKEEMWNFFSERHYSIHLPNRVPHYDDGLSLEGFLDGHIYPRRTTNYIAIPEERRKEVMERARHKLGIR